MKRWLLALRTRVKESSRRAKLIGLLVAALVLGGGGFAVYQLTPPRIQPPKPSRNADAYVGEPVPLNLSSAVETGFRGDVHPLLHGQTKLELTAQWIADSARQNSFRKFTINEYHFFLDMTPAKERQTYTGRDFAVFLPEKLGAAGQMWSLDAKKVADLLRQFHPLPSMHLNGDGRRVGPDGAFAILRGVSPAYLDIAFRIHAEFDISSDLPAGLSAKGWYAPAFFSGQMIVNRAKGTVDYFHLELPTDRSLNVQLTLKPLDAGAADRQKSASHFMARVERMELQGGDKELAVKTAKLAASLTPAEAQRRLEKVFYKFMDIDWLPFANARAAGRDQNKPILAVVLWGNLDDQSC